MSDDADRDREADLEALRETIATDPDDAVDLDVADAADWIAASDPEPEDLPALVVSLYRLLEQTLEHTDGLQRRVTELEGERSGEIEDAADDGESDASEPWTRGFY